MGEKNIPTGPDGKPKVTDDGLEDNGYNSPPIPATAEESQ